MLFEVEIIYSSSLGSATGIKVAVAYTKELVFLWAKRFDVIL